jgi:hypothetical protein
MKIGHELPTVEVLLVVAKPNECQSQQKSDSQLEEVASDVVRRIAPVLMMSPEARCVDERTSMYEKYVRRAI